ncbi:MAG: ribose 5-phosphate isomerase B [Candidatus Binatia bacterium]
MSSTIVSREAATAAKSKSFLVASDHAAVSAKAVVVDELRAAGFDVRDLGTTDTSSVDYPDYAEAVARGVAGGEAGQGVLLCGSGIGMSIAANKVDGIRAALVHDVTGAALARQHNDANVLVLGGAMIGERLIRDIVKTWINSRFEGGRHQRRIDKIDRIQLTRGVAAGESTRGDTPTPDSKKETP